MDIFWNYTIWFSFNQSSELYFADNSSHNQINKVNNRTLIHYLAHLKGLGHAILGNFSTDQMVIELTKI